MNVFDGRSANTTARCKHCQVVGGHALRELDGNAQLPICLSVEWSVRMKQLPLSPLQQRNPLRVRSQRGPSVLAASASIDFFLMSLSSSSSPSTNCVLSSAGVWVPQILCRLRWSHRWKRSVAGPCRQARVGSCRAPPSHDLDPAAGNLDDSRLTEIAAERRGLFGLALRARRACDLAMDEVLGTSSL